VQPGADREHGRRLGDELDVAVQAHPAQIGVVGAGLGEHRRPGVAAEVARLLARRVRPHEQVGTDAREPHRREVRPPVGADRREGHRPLNVQQRRHLGLGHRHTPVTGHPGPPFGSRWTPPVRRRYNQTMYGSNPIEVRSGDVVLRGEHWPARGRAATAVLGPGGGQARGSWTRTARRLAADGFGALTLDLRGHGDSDRSPGGDYRPATFAADVRAICAAVEGPVVIVGASMSGLAGLLAVGEHPGCAAGLVLVDIAIDTRPEGVDRVRGFLSGSRSGFGSLEEFALAVAGYTAREPAPAERMRRHARRGADGRWYWHWDPAFMADHHDFGTDRPRLVAAARTLTVPVLLVRGLESDVVSEVEVAAMRHLVPQLQVLDVAGAGHMLTGDDNDVFGGGLARFLATIAGG
jgi:non-heme chloroperoxidase